MVLDVSDASGQVSVVSYVPHLPQFDLASIRLRIAKDHSDLTPEKLNELEQRYRQFLRLCKVEPGIRHEPDKDVDLYWHAHILHTKQYMEDCERYFGYFLHHLPNASGQGCDDGCAIIPS
jgi:hypothetical protein